MKIIISESQLKQIIESEEKKESLFPIKANEFTKMIKIGGKIYGD